MNGINIMQNKIEFLRYQFCIRQLYSMEKRVYVLVMGFNLLIFALGAIPSVNELEYFFVVPILWLPLNQFLDSIRIGYHNKAVNYHEYKDRVMYDLEIPYGMIPKKQTILQDSISFVERKRMKDKFEVMMNGNHSTTIKNWYNNFGDYPLNIATIMSQDENTKWELRQRDLYQCMLYILFCIVIAVDVIIIQVGSYEVVSLLYAMPFVLTIWNEICRNRTVCNELKSCREIIGSIYLSIKNGDLTDEFVDEKVKTVQMKLFLSRKDSNSVPDIVYKIFRSKLQSESDQYFLSLNNEIGKSVKIT